MLYTEYDSEKALEIRGQEEYEKGRAEGKAEGKAEGIAEGEAKGKIEGILKTLVELVKDGILTIADASKRANMTVEEFEHKTELKE